MASQADIFGAVGGWISERSLVHSFAYIDETTHDTFAVIEGIFGFDPREEPRLRDLGSVSEPVFGPRMTSDSRAALEAALNGIQLRYIADWRSFVSRREACAEFANHRRALHLSAPMPHRDDGLLYLVAVNVDNGICEGLTYVLEVGWTGAGFVVLRVVQEGDWVAG